MRRFVSLSIFVTDSSGPISANVRQNSQKTTFELISFEQFRAGTRSLTSLPNESPSVPSDTRTNFYIGATTSRSRGNYHPLMGTAGLQILTRPHMDIDGLTDEQLIETLRDVADRGWADDLFSEVFRRYERRVRAWCERFTGDRELALDLAQEVFLKAYRHLASFRCDSRFSTWLFAVTQNHCRNSNMRRRFAALEIDEAMADRLPDESAVNAYEEIERKQLYRLMWELIAVTLNPIEARVMALHYGQEVPLAAITQRLSLSNRSGAKAYIVSARRKLNGAIRRRAEKIAG
jgi:RNA polymerase sigma-70 factor, ECF subfamily